MNKSTKSLVTIITPTIHIKGVDIKKIVDNYNKGYYNNISISTLPKIKLNDITNIVSSTNQQPRPKLNRCMWCLRELIQPIGIPIDIWYLSNEDSILILTMEPNYCSFECTYAALIRELGYNYVARDPLYCQSEMLLKTWYNLLYPNQPLIPAGDRYLLDQNGGQLTSDEYQRSGHLYYKLPNIIVESGKFNYVSLS